ncbi:MAG: tRNA pseudouridine(55) synthase TruB [bacterium]|nr:tRNA pseudouridine(55) synthase TruB [bacterium]
MTSFSVVAYIRKLTGIKKVGHAGTLDPAADGILLVAVGKATKRIEGLMGMEKEYVGNFKFGITTDSFDAEGKITDQRSCEGLSEDLIRKELENFKGTIDQVPPVFSALKHKGKPLYKYARKGIKIEPAPRKVKISEIALESFKKDEARIRVVCSRGTYIRSIANDLGEALGCGAILNGLTRERIGSYMIKDSISMEGLPEKIEELFE